MTPDSPKNKRKTAQEIVAWAVEILIALAALIKMCQHGSPALRKWVLIGLVLFLLVALSIFYPSEEDARVPNEMRLKRLYEKWAGDFGQPIRGRQFALALIGAALLALAFILFAR